MWRDVDSRLGLPDSRESTSSIDASQDKTFVRRYRAVPKP